MLTISLFPPRPCSCAVTESVAPWTMPTRSVTDRTPIIIPSIVRNDRILLLSMAEKAILTACVSFISSSPPYAFFLLFPLLPNRQLHHRIYCPSRYVRQPGAHGAWPQKRYGCRA